MSAIRLTVLGAGSVRCTPAIVASLATYFGERPLEICLFDSDEERLDLFDRLARVCFIATYSSNRVRFTTDIHESLDAADLVVVTVGPNCARKYLRGYRRQGTAELDDRSMIEQAVETMTALIPSTAEVLSLVDREIVLPRQHYYHLDWPAAIPIAERPSVPHQVLRWVRGEEGVQDLLRRHDGSPFKAWLDSPASAELVRSRPSR